MADAAYGGSYEAIYKAWQDAMSSWVREQQAHARTQSWLDEFQGKCAAETARALKLQNQYTALLREYAAQAIASLFVGRRVDPSMVPRFREGTPAAVLELVDKYIDDCVGVGPCDRCGKRAPLTHERVCAWGCEP